MEKEHPLARIRRIEDTREEFAEVSSLKYIAPMLGAIIYAAMELNPDNTDNPIISVLKSSALLISVAVGLYHYQEANRIKGEFTSEFPSVSLRQADSLEI